ncbi:hypothetical protein EON64_00610 [archaeon]|nr:MAG: hypothetical protein EON64_00610 [archaeon]
MYVGDCFGERALENEDSLRMASIVTGEDSTELLVLSREDYNNLVFLTMQGDSAHKLKLLRKTDLFRTLDSVHLQAVTRYMEPRKYQIDEHIVTAGKRAMEMVIIETGECRAVTEITEGYEKMTDEQKSAMSYHRLLEQANGTADDSSKHSKPEVDKSSKDNLKLDNKSKLKSNAPKPDALSVSLKEIKQNDTLSKPVDTSKGGAAEQAQSSSEKKGTRRFHSQELVAITKKKVVDLGRIGPNSVLASYIALLNDVHEDVYHPETIIASTLVTAYTIGKHDLLAHLAKDSYLAINKVVQEHKKPVLSFLWENVPRMLDENQWRLEKTWEKFRSQMFTDQHRNVNILHTLKNLNKMHITANSGNDHLLRVVSTGKHQSSEGAGTGEEEMHQPKAQVSINWGLPSKAALPSIGSEEQKGAKPDSLSQPTSLSTATILPPAGSETLPVELNSKLSSKIRQRLNESHASTAALEQAAPTATRRTSAEAVLDSPLRARTPQTPKSHARSEFGSSLRPLQKADSINQLPFTLVQIHREFTRANPLGMVENGRRVVRSYIRLCGSYHTCARTKELADMQMEQIFLTLFQSEATKENELLLNWSPFRGFEGMSVNDSDIFLIYCRSAPLEYATLNPSKNIFNMAFPAVCRAQNQRFSVIVANRLKDIKHSDGTGGHDDSDEEGDATSKVTRPQDSIASSAMEGDDAVDDKVYKRGHRSQRKASVTGASSADLSQVLMDNAPVLEHATSTSNAPSVAPSAFSSRAVTRNNQRNNGDKSSKAKAWPLYLLEVSMLYEVLVTACSRLEGLKYVMRRFGSMTDEVPANSSAALEEATRTGSRRKGMNNLLSTDGGGGKSTGVIHTGFSKKVFLKPYNNKQPDRILKVVQQENKLICVVPLFKWILINPDTLDTLDFTNSFNESNIRKIFLAENIDKGDQGDAEEWLEGASHDDLGPVDDASMSSFVDPVNIPSNYRDLNEEFKEKQLDTILVKSVSEAGLIPSYRVHRQDETLQVSKSLQALPEQSDRLLMTSSVYSVGVEGKLVQEGYFDDHFMHTKAVQIFERELTSKEMAKQVHTFEQATLLQSANQNALLDTATESKVPSFLGQDPEPTAGPSSSSKLAASNYQGIIEKKLLALSQSVKLRSKVLRASDELYDQEHDTILSTKSRLRLLHHDGDQNSISSAAAHKAKKTQPNKSKDQQLQLLHKRLNVIESLQRVGSSTLLGDTKFSLASLMPIKKPKSSVDNDEDATFKSVHSIIYSSNRATTPSAESGMSSATNKFLSAQKRQQVLAASIGQVGSAGKKLADSLKVLSESLEQQHFGATLPSTISNKT